MYNYLWVVVFRGEILKYSQEAQDKYNESFDTYDLSQYEPGEIAVFFIQCPLATLSNMVNINPVKHNTGLYFRNKY